MRSGFVLSRVRDLHRDEKGIEQINVVMIIAIGALVLVGLIAFGNTIFKWLKEKWDEIAGQKVG